MPLASRSDDARVGLDGALRAVPFLPTSTTSLYLHTFPGMHARDGFTVGNSVFNDDEGDKHKLDESSFERFWSKAWNEGLRFTGRGWDSKTMKPRSSGGEEPVQDKWDTFSKDVNDIEYLHNPSGRCMFERLEFQDLPLSEEPSIYRELAIYDQFATDFSWRGVDRSIAWVGAMRQEDAVALHAMQVPVDGDPPPATPDEEVVEAGWGDDPEPDFSMAPVVRPPVVADEIKVVVFDLYGVILHTIDGLTRLYLEAEAHLIRDRPDVLGEQLVHAALRDMLCTVGLCLADDIIRCALDAIRPAPYADVPDALRTLQQRGYKLLCLVSCDASHVSDTGTFLPPEVPDLHTQTEGVCSQVAEECRSIVPEIKNTEILLVTTGLYRIVELANAAGIPTALVQRPSVDEAQLERKTEQGELSSPTMTVGGLGELCDKLDLMRSGSIG
ncbi:predicted protein [Postia placenta Mad-698-R]|nr:predicted protein [Postia placenta Mad-698-R]